MTQFMGRKCDICNKEDREEAQDIESTLRGVDTASTEPASPRVDPWMKVWWMSEQHFCPSCAALVSSAVNFTRNMVRNRP